MRLIRNNSTDSGTSSSESSSSSGNSSSSSSSSSSSDSSSSDSDQSSAVSTRASSESEPDTAKLTKKGSSSKSRGSSKQQLLSSSNSSLPSSSSSSSRKPSSSSHQAASGNSRKTGNTGINSTARKNNSSHAASIASAAAIASGSSASRKKTGSAAAGGGGTQLKKQQAAAAANKGSAARVSQSRALAKAQPLKKHPSSLGTPKKTPANKKSGVSSSKQAAAEKKAAAVTSSENSTESDNSSDDDDEKSEDESDQATRPTNNKKTAANRTSHKPHPNSKTSASSKHGVSSKNQHNSTGSSHKQSSESIKSMKDISSSSAASKSKSSSKSSSSLVQRAVASSQQQHNKHHKHKHHQHQKTPVKAGQSSRASDINKTSSASVNKSKFNKKDIEFPTSKKSREKLVSKSSESSTNSSTASSGTESGDSSTESSEASSDRPTIKSQSNSNSRHHKTTHHSDRRRKSAATASDKDDSENDDTDDTEKDESDKDSDKEAAETPRKHITRSSSVKTKRSNLLGISKGTDSESENNGAPPGKSSRRSHGARSSMLSKKFEPMPGETRPPTSNKKPLHSSRLAAQAQEDKCGLGELTPPPPIEKRSCPVDGCNSQGHLGGLHPQHFTVEACPIFHNTAPDKCKSEREVWMTMMEERRRCSELMAKKSPRNSTTTDQRTYCNKIREEREKMSEVQPGEEEELADSDRQPSLTGHTPAWDLKLFQHAQQQASIKIEDDLRGLPDTKGIRYLEMGHYEMEAWYQSQYPDQYNHQPKIYVCEFCLKYMRSKTVLHRHMDKCVWRHPPGDEIYRKEKLSVWEVDGKKYKTYCQNLCLLAMLFLDHKTLYYDVEPFLFYIMTHGDHEGCHIIGYFSKEKNSFLNYNVSCIMTLPPYQRKGYGRLLIDFSYLLTKEEGKIGSPEKPLSDLGLISYRSYWKDLLLSYLSNYSEANISIKDMSQEMAVNSYDIVSTFQYMGMMKYWKGKHILLRRQDLLEEYIERRKKRRADHREIDERYLNWRPYVAPPEDPPPSSTSGNGANNTTTTTTTNNNINNNAAVSKDRKKKNSNNNND